MAQRLITIAINFEDENEAQVASNLLAGFASEASTIEEAVNLIVESWQAMPGMEIPHWSCPTTQNWQTQQEEISALCQSISSHVCACCHSVAEAPAGATDFVKGECPPVHNCTVCAATII